MMGSILCSLQQNVEGFICRCCFTNVVILIVYFLFYICNFIENVIKVKKCVSSDMGQSCFFTYTSSIKIIFSIIIENRLDSVTQTYLQTTVQYKNNFNELSTHFSTHDMNTNSSQRQTRL